MRHAWDVWGRGDNLGTLNRLTGPVVAAAASGVRTGERVGVSLPIGLPDPPFFGRKGLRHSFESMGPGVWDDWVQKSYAALKILQPARWNKPEHSEASVDAIR